MLWPEAPHTRTCGGYRTPWGRQPPHVRCMGRGSARDQILGREVEGLALEVDQVALRDEVVALPIPNEVVLRQHQRLTHEGIVLTGGDADAREQQADVADAVEVVQRLHDRQAGRCL